MKKPKVHPFVRPPRRTPATAEADGLTVTVRVDGASLDVELSPEERTIIRAMARRALERWLAAGGKP